MSIEIRNNVARVAKVEITRADKCGAYLALQLHIELTAAQLKQFVEGRYAVSDQSVYGALYAEWERKYQEAERNWQDRTNAIMHEYNLACEDADERGKPRPSPPKLAKFIGPSEPEQIKASRPCKSLKEWYVHVHAELVDEDQQIQRVELGASTKGTPRLTTEGALALLELRLDERYCEHSAEKDEVWEWLQLAGQEFRVFGAQLTIDDVLDEEEAEEVAQPQLDIYTPNLAASIEADLRAKGHDVAVEAVPVEESKTIAQWSQELGEPFTVEEYISALKATGYSKPIRPVTRLTKAQHLQVLVGLSLRVAPAIDQVRKPRWEWAAEYGCSSPQYFDAMSAVLPNPDNTFAMSRVLTEEEHEAVCAELRRRGVNRAEQNEADEDTEKNAAYWSDIAGVPQDDYMTALQALEPWVDWGSVIPAELHEKAVGLLQRWAERDSKRDEQSEAERRDFGVCKTANTWAREAGANGKAYVRTAIALGVFPDDASPIRVKFNESTHLRIMAAMSGEQPAA